MEDKNLTVKEQLELALRQYHKLERDADIVRKEFKMVEAKEIKEHGKIISYIDKRRMYIYGKAMELKWKTTELEIKANNFKLDILEPLAFRYRDLINGYADFGETILPHDFKSIIKYYSRAKLKKLKEQAYEWHKEAR